jgi:hypothetical protein
MYTASYYKIANCWFLDYPEYIEQGGDPGNLERIGAFAEFLDLASKGESFIVFNMDIQPFEGADVFELIGSTGEKTGGYYSIRSFENQEVDFELWFNTLIYINNQELPLKIWVKRSAL